MLVENMISITKSIIHKLFSIVPMFFVLIIDKEYSKHDRRCLVHTIIKE